MSMFAAFTEAEVVYRRERIVAGYPRRPHHDHHRGFQLPLRRNRHGVPQSRHHQPAAG